MKKIILFFFIAFNLNAGTHIVTSNADDGEGSLRKIVADANANDTIVFASNINQVNLTGSDIEISKDLTIIGGEYNNKVTIKAGEGRIFYMNGKHNFAINNLILSEVIYDRTSWAWGEWSGGAIYVRYGNLIATNCEFINNNNLYGGGVSVSDGFFIATNCVFSNNTTGTRIGSAVVIGMGGAVYVQDATCISINCVFSNNTALGPGGALSVEGSFIAINSSFYGNSGTYGGAIFGGKPYLYHCTIDSNNASRNGGAIETFKNVETYSNNSIFSGNRVADTLNQIGRQEKVGYITGIIPSGENLIEDGLDITRNRVFRNNKYIDGHIMPTLLAKSAPRLTAIDIETSVEIDKDTIIHYLIKDARGNDRPKTGFVTYGAVECDSTAGPGLYNFDIIIAPNPAEKDFFIIFDFDNPQKEKITIELIDLEGKKVLDICEGIVTAGYQVFRVDAKLLASATYFVKMIFGDKIIVRKVVVKK